jgi:hypothetical protein
MMLFQISKMQGIRDFAAIRERDREEFREMLLTLSTTQKTLRASSATEEIMQFLQTELEDPGLGSQEVQRLRQALLALEEDTSTVKPHADCNLPNHLHNITV